MHTNIRCLHIEIISLKKYLLIWFNMSKMETKQHEHIRDEGEPMSSKAFCEL